MDFFFLARINTDAYDSLVDVNLIFPVALNTFGNFDSE